MTSNNFGFGKDIEDLLGLTDSEESSSSSSENGLFDTHQPLILELHELKKDDPKTENAPPEAKIKKHKKKKKQAKSHISMTSSGSISEEGSVRPGTETTEDEFYDAHESYTALSGHQLQKPVTAIGLAQAHSEHGQDPKAPLNPASSPSTQQTSSTPKTPSALTKSVTEPQ